MSFMQLLVIFYCIRQRSRKSWEQTCRKDVNTFVRAQGIKLNLVMIQPAKCTSNINIESNPKQISGLYEIMEVSMTGISIKQMDKYRLIKQTKSAS